MNIENESIYEASRNKFNDIIVFNGVMCKHEKWALELYCETTHSCPECGMGNEESGGSTKRSEKPTSDGSTVKRPTGRDAAKKRKIKEKGIYLDKEREQKIDEMELMKMQLVHLNTLLQNEQLSLEEENLKCFLMSNFYGN
uniref:Uncharacterized protein n=1 Tax=Lactuca sativa TaxID=4236 RepID=A0A9R1WS51_LACSA|nr:hypothetical protein LSAT_V11C100044990 [Lactuca sativa]